MTRDPGDSPSGDYHRDQFEREDDVSDGGFWIDNATYEKLRLDAERYRWLRDPARDNAEITMLVTEDEPTLQPGDSAWYGYSGAALDAAIDAARKP